MSPQSKVEEMVRTQEQTQYRSQKLAKERWQREAGVKLMENREKVLMETRDEKVRPSQACVCVRALRVSGRRGSHTATMSCCSAGWLASWRRRLSCKSTQ